jgi:hypothetical protein
LINIEKKEKGKFIGLVDLLRIPVNILKFEIKIIKGKRKFLIGRSLAFTSEN